MNTPNTPNLPPEPDMADLDLDYLDPAILAALHLTDEDEIAWTLAQDADAEQAETEWMGVLAMDD